MQILHPLTAFAFLFTVAALDGQVIVKGTDLNAEVELFELYAFKKPFTTKECYFINYGQKKFRLHFYDHKSQAIFDKDGNKFEKGQWLSLYKYLRDEGWEKVDERTEKLGNVKGRVITFEKVNETR